MFKTISFLTLPWTTLTHWLHRWNVASSFALERATGLTKMLRVLDMAGILVVLSVVAPITLLLELDRLGSEALGLLDPARYRDIETRHHVALYSITVPRKP